MTYESFERDALHIEQLEEARREEVISAYLDGELSPAASRHVTTWLDQHPDALRNVEHLRRVWDLLDAYEDEPVPEGFFQRVLERAGAARSRRGLLAFPPRRLALAAAAGILVAVGALLFFGRGTEPAPRTTDTASVLEVVPADLLESVDLLLGLSDEEFRSYLLSDPLDLEAQGG